MLAQVRLDGVRIASDPNRSGAVFTLNDGRQHARAIGQEVAPGVLLAAVGEDHVVLAIRGERYRFELGRGLVETPVNANSPAAETAPAAPRSP